MGGRERSRRRVRVDSALDSEPLFDLHKLMLLVDESPRSGLEVARYDHSSFIIQARNIFLDCTDTLS